MSDLISDNGELVINLIGYYMDFEYREILNSIVLYNNTSTNRFNSNVLTSPTITSIKFIGGMKSADNSISDKLIEITNLISICIDINRLKSIEFINLSNIETDQMLDDPNFQLTSLRKWLHGVNSNYPNKVHYIMVK